MASPTPGQITYPISDIQVENTIDPIVPPDVTAAQGEMIEYAGFPTVFRLFNPTINAAVRDGVVYRLTYRPAIAAGSDAAAFYSALVTLSGKSGTELSFTARNQDPS